MASDAELAEENARLRSMLMNARNILHAEGYLYADEIDSYFDSHDGCGIFILNMPSPDGEK